MKKARENRTLLKDTVKSSLIGILTAIVILALLSFTAEKKPGGETHRITACAPHRSLFHPQL